ncbi:MAG: type I-B CRISPR-associated protein Cas7/Csh2 [Victivallales bacterium]|nr:type I-B CRISPR-associated protein Cas7/Csh2 [Victivallales bacterium]MCF7888737.1 type I-B CRISPR-associated protein Cas7/Csh2 [Victivallales bacterium]
MCIKNRRELLFIYDVKNANPNGDPADENKPRIDQETGYNIVTDVRLKRTIRNYLFDYMGHNPDNKKDIFVRTTKTNEGKGIKDGKHRALDFGSKKEEMLENILTKCIDIRLFGGVLPLEKDSITYTGPVQFKMGKSLNKVELKYIKGTGAFASKNGSEQQTFREEYILPYSLIAFYGIINENAAQNTGLTDQDVESLKTAMWNGTKHLISRSKFEHTPQLLIEVTYKDENFFIGELDKYVAFEKEILDEEVRDIQDGIINLELLSGKLNKYEDKIKKIEIRKGERISISGLSEIKFQEV